MYMHHEIFLKDGLELASVPINKDFEEMPFENNS